jgi:hypothetical protein
MFVTRRKFVQSSIAASIAVAAESTHTGWLLSSSDPLRIGIAGLGPSAPEHLALYAAIPGAKVTHIADPSRAAIAAAVSQLQNAGHPSPRVSHNLDGLLADPSLHAISLPRESPNAGFTLKQIFSRRLPVLTDILPSSLSLPANACSKYSQLHLRIGDLIYPGVTSDLSAWSRRRAAACANKDAAVSALTLQRKLLATETRAVLVSTLHALLQASPIATSSLTRWAEAEGSFEIARARTVARVNLPDPPTGPKCLAIELLPRNSGASLLSVRDKDGLFEVPVWRQPDAQTSLRTVMQFLDSVRTRADNSTALAPAVAAIAVADRIFRSLRIAENAN